MSRIEVTLLQDDENPAEIGFLFRPKDYDDVNPPTPAEIVDALTDALLEMYGGMPIIVNRRQDS